MWFINYFLLANPWSIKRVNKQRCQCSGNFLISGNLSQMVLYNSIGKTKCSGYFHPVQDFLMTLTGISEQVCIQMWVIHWYECFWLWSNCFIDMELNVWKECWRHCWFTLQEYNEDGLFGLKNLVFLKLISKLLLFALHQLTFYTFVFYAFLFRLALTQY